MARKILHVDLDAFFCSVEELINPNLRGRAFVVGGSPQARGVVSSCSYAARYYGIHSAMPMKIAVKKYPDLIIVTGHYKEYNRKSQLVMHLLGKITPIIEQISIDEAFLDVSDMQDSLEVIVNTIQTTILKEIQLPVSLGGASNKLVAKIANNVGKKSNKTKQAPCSVCIVPPDHEAEFLAPLPIEEMWGIGQKTANLLKQLGITTIGAIANYPLSDLAAHFGNLANVLKNRARGMDERPVSDIHEIKSISNEITFSIDKVDVNELRKAILHLSQKVAFRLRYNSMMGTTIRIKVRWSDFQTHTRQISLREPTSQESLIYSKAADLFNSIWDSRQPVRLIGVGVSQLCRFSYQLPLFANESEKENKLLQTIDLLNSRFGKGTILRADNLIDKKSN